MPYDTSDMKLEAAADDLARLCRSSGISSVSSDAAQNLVLRMAMEAFKKDDVARNVLRCMLERCDSVSDYAEQLSGEYADEAYRAEQAEHLEQLQHERIEGASWRFV